MKCAAVKKGRGRVKIAKEKAKGKAFGARDGKPSIDEVYEGTDNQRIAQEQAESKDAIQSLEVKGTLWTGLHHTVHHF